MNSRGAAIRKYQIYLRSDASQIFQLIAGLFSLLAGLLIGVSVLSLLPVEPSLEKAHELGIISRTILDGYPKHLEIPYYVVGVSVTLLSGLAIFLAVSYLHFSRGGVWGDYRQEERGLTVPEENRPPRMGVVKWAGLALFIFVVTFYREFFYCNWYWWDWGFFFEEGIYLRWVDELLRGKILYKEIYYYGGPFLVWPQYWLAELFGPSILLGRIYAYFCYFIGYLIVFAVLRQVTGNKLFLLAGLLLTVYFYFPMLPVVQQSLGRFAVSLVPLYFLHAFFFNRRSAYLVLGGVSLGFALFLSQDLGLASFVAMVAMSAAYNYRERNLKGFFIHVLLIGTGVLVILIPVLAYFWFHDALCSLYEAMVVVPGYYSIGAWSLRFPNFMEIFSSSGESQYGRTEILLAYWPVAFYLGSVFFCLILFLRRKFTNRSILLFGIATLGGVMFQRAFGIYSLMKIKNVLYPIFILTAAHMDLFWSKGRFSTVCRKEMHRKIEIFFYASCALFILFGLVGYFQPRVFWPGTRPHTHYLQRGELWKSYSPIDVSRAENIQLPLPVAQMVREVVEYIKGHTSPDEPVYVFPYAPMYYFLTERESPTRYPVVYAITKDIREQTVRSLQDEGVRYVVYAYSTPALGVSTEEKFPEIDSYIRNAYKVERRFGDTTILRLKERPAD